MDRLSLQVFPQIDNFDDGHDIPDSIAYLEVLDQEDDENHEISIYPRQELRVGRESSKCNYTIEDGRVSKQHFRIYSIIYEEGRRDLAPLIYCEDLESSNGTYVNSVLIGIICRERRGYLLNDGDIIEIRPGWKFQFHQTIPTAFHDATASADLQDFQDQFPVSDRILGEGCYGSVYLAQETTTLKQVACKVVDLTACADKHMEHRYYKKAGNLWQDQLWRAAEGRKIAMREIKILSQLSHPHIIDLKKAFCTPTSLYMITELAPGGDLFSYLESYGAVLEDWHARVISLQLTLAIEHLHSRGIAHRDIKLENVLITQTGFGGRVILTDFGFANVADVKTGRLGSLVGTSGFIAPEVESDELRKEGYTFAADLWSLGVLTACLLTGNSIIPLRELSQSSQLEIAARFLEINDPYTRDRWVNMTPRAQRFLRKLLNTDPSERMTATEALDHSWFKKPHSEGALLQDRYHKIIRFWEKREVDDQIIEYIRNAPPQASLESQDPKFRKKLPDASLSPYFSLDRHLLQRPPATRKRVLESLAQSASPFVPSQESQINCISNSLAQRERCVSVISVTGRDIFGGSQETETLDPIKNAAESDMLPTKSMMHSEELDLQNSIQSLEPEVEDSKGESEEDDNRKKKRARKLAWDPKDMRAHSGVTKEASRLVSAEVFRNTIRD